MTSSIHKTSTKSVRKPRIRKATKKIGELIKVKDQSDNADVSGDYTKLDYPLFRIIEGEIIENNIIVLKKQLLESFCFLGLHGDFDLNHSINMLHLMARLTNFEYYANKYSEGDYGKASKNLKELVTYAKHHQKSLEERRNLRFKTGNVFFYDLQFLFKRDEDVMYQDNVLMSGKIKSFELRYYFGIPYYRCTTTQYFFSQNNFYDNEKEHRIFVFEKANLSELPIQILTSDVKNTLIERGKKYVEYTKKSSVKYNPSFAYKEQKVFFNSRTIKILENSRCVIDFYAFASCNQEHTKVVVDDDNEKQELIANEFLHYLPGLVPGYSLTKRTWFEYEINLLTPVIWNNNVFDKVVLDSKLKNIILTLVQEQKNAAFSDIIDNKGKGVVFLLSGPTGVGKTLIAEAVSETTNRPLIRVSLQDLGISPEILEKNLEKIFAMAEDWNGVFLFDECDVFLESRKANDLERNAIVAAFLRHLEYFNGILFLTTNSENNLDSAVLSRVTLPIKFPSLKPNTKIEIWKGLISETGIKISDSEFKRLVKMELPGNGRQIKNAIATSLRIAKSENREVTSQDLENIIGYFAEFAKSQND